MRKRFSTTVQAKYLLWHNGSNENSSSSRSPLIPQRLNAVSLLKANFYKLFSILLKRLAEQQLKFLPVRWVGSTSWKHLPARNGGNGSLALCSHNSISTWCNGQASIWNFGLFWNLSNTNEFNRRSLERRGAKLNRQPSIFLALTFLPLDQLPKDSVQHFWFANTSFDTN